MQTDAVIFQQVDFGMTSTVPHLDTDTLARNPEREVGQLRLQLQRHLGNYGWKLI